MSWFQVGSLGLICNFLAPPSFIIFYNLKKLPVTNALAYLSRMLMTKKITQEILHLNFFTAVIITPVRKASVFVTASHFQPSLIFVGKTCA